MVLGNTKETEDCYNKILSLSQNLKYTLKKNWEKYVSGYRFENKVKKDIKKNGKYMVQNISRKNNRVLSRLLP